MDVELVVPGGTNPAPMTLAYKLMRQQDATNDELNRLKVQIVEARSVIGEMELKMEQKAGIFHKFFASFSQQEQEYRYSLDLYNAKLSDSEVLSKCMTDLMSNGTSLCSKVKESEEKWDGIKQDVAEKKKRIMQLSSRLEDIESKRKSIKESHGSFHVRLEELKMENEIAMRQHEESELKLSELSECLAERLLRKKSLSDEINSFVSRTAAIRDSIESNNQSSTNDLVRLSVGQTLAKKKEDLQGCIDELSIQINRYTEANRLEATVSSRKQDVKDLKETLSFATQMNEDNKKIVERARKAREELEMHRAPLLAAISENGPLHDRESLLIEAKEAEAVLLDAKRRGMVLERLCQGVPDILGHLSLTSEQLNTQIANIVSRLFDLSMDSSGTSMQLDPFSDSLKPGSTSKSQSKTDEMMKAMDAVLKTIFKRFGSIIGRVKNVPNSGESSLDIGAFGKGALLKRLLEVYRSHCPNFEVDSSALRLDNKSPVSGNKQVSMSDIIDSDDSSGSDEPKSITFEGAEADRDEVLTPSKTRASRSRLGNRRRRGPQEPRESLQTEILALLSQVFLEPAGASSDYARILDSLPLDRREQDPLALIPEGLITSNPSSNARLEWSRLVDLGYEPIQRRLCSLASMPDANFPGTATATQELGRSVAEAVRPLLHSLLHFRGGFAAALLQFAEENCQSELLQTEKKFVENVQQRIERIKEEILEVERQAVDSNKKRKSLEAKDSSATKDSSKKTGRTKRTATPSPTLTSPSAEVGSKRDRSALLKERGILPEARISESDNSSSSSISPLSYFSSCNLKTSASASSMMNSSNTDSDYNSDEVSEKSASTSGSSVRGRYSSRNGNTAMQTLSKSSSKAKDMSDPSAAKSQPKTHIRKSVAPTPSVESTSVAAKASTTLRFDGKLALSSSLKDKKSSRFSLDKDLADLEGYASDEGIRGSAVSRGGDSASSRVGASSASSKAGRLSAVLQVPVTKYSLSASGSAVSGRQSASSSAIATNFWTSDD